MWDPLSHTEDESRSVNSHHSMLKKFILAGEISTTFGQVSKFCHYTSYGGGGLCTHPTRPVPEANIEDPFFVSVPSVWRVGDSRILQCPPSLCMDPFDRVVHLTLCTIFSACSFPTPSSPFVLPWTPSFLRTTVTVTVNSTSIFLLHRKPSVSDPSPVRSVLFYLTFSIFLPRPSTHKLFASSLRST